MPFVELHREFISLAKDQLPFVDAVRSWGSKTGWPELLKHRRVVLLAEASSGKTQEFKNQRTRLIAEGKTAFFLAIETLADHGFLEALSWEEVSHFESWREGTSDAWFFLDSVDEARLARKSFETALKRLAKELGGELSRAFVLVSSRITDWKGADDFEIVRQMLPVRNISVRPENDADGNPLLDPIFSKKKEKVLRNVEIVPTAPIVVQLAALNETQYRSLALSAGVKDIDAFVSSIVRHGLHAFTERPGDILDLAGYWRTYQRFGPFVEMIEDSVRRKLTEIDTHRPDNGVLSATKAREGAEQIAAALTFGKSFTLRAPTYDPDPTLAAGALDAAAILPSWTDEERNALLRKGIFAPASYGRVRFHHRSTQEYLAAEWLHRLLQGSCPQEEIWNLFFVERYGVATVVPSLRPIAAWLTRRHPIFQDEMIKREPLSLIRSGDPGSLPLGVKERILKAYAALNVAGQGTRSGLESRSLWMFADQALAPAIHEAWKANPTDELRDDLIRLIRDGAITACANLAREVVLDKGSPWHLRAFALQAVVACKDEQGLALAAHQILIEPSETDSRVAASFAQSLYPQYLSTTDLLTLFRDTIPAPKGSNAAFSYRLVDYYQNAPGADARRELVEGVADLCLSQPFLDPYRRVSKQYRFLAKQVHEIAALEVKRTSEPPASGLIRLLMVAERIEKRFALSKDEDNLVELVRQRRELSHALFWADVEEHRLNECSSYPPIRFWQVHLGGHQTLWDFEACDLASLFDQLANRETEDDRRLVLSAIMALFSPGPERENAAQRARAIVAGSSVLEEDIRGYLAAPVEDETAHDHRRRATAREAKEAIATEKAKASWQEFAAHLQSDISLLSNPKNFSTWKAGMFRFKHLLEWLQLRSNTHDDKALRDWRLLDEGFGRPVAEAFREGLRHLWRLSLPQRPVHTANNGITVSWQTILAFGAVGVEAAEDPDWTAYLTVQEAKRAAEHGCFSEQGYPDWLDRLFASFPEAVAPIIRKAVEQEWLAAELAVSNLIHQYATTSFVIPPTVQTLICAIILQNEAGRVETLGLGIKILGKSALNLKSKAALTAIARSRLASHRRAKREDYAFRYLAMLFVVDPDYAIVDLIRWIKRGSVDERKERAERSLAILFDRHNPMVADALNFVSLAGLEKLLYLGYREVRIEHDLLHEGSYTPSRRDDAESARSTILSALIERPGAGAYEILHRAASHSDFLIRADRFRQIAKEKAEKDAESEAWLPAEVVAMERKHIAPIKTGDDLFRIVTAVLSDIKFDLIHGDASSRELLERAQDEDEVQKWLLEHLNLRAKDRYHAHREAEVADGDKPDIIVSSASAKVEIAIEIKHGGKGWTLRQLENALRKQLTVDYVKPTTRRHGILVVSQHTKRRWLEIGTKTPISFDDVLDYLSNAAVGITRNKFGEVKVCVVGINAWVSKADAKTERNTSMKDRLSKKNVNHTVAVPSASGKARTPSGAKIQPALRPSKRLRAALRKVGRD